MAGVKIKHSVLEQHLETHGKILDHEDIVQLTIDQLIERLQNGSLSCLEVLRAYQAKVKFIKLLFISL